MSEEEKKYLKAKEDILQAAKSFLDLFPQWKEKLSTELYETAKVLAMQQIMRRYLEWGGLLLDVNPLFEKRITVEKGRKKPSPIQDSN